jgi:beta-lactamase superfamily II metal-dependent hydrolase
MRKVYHSKGVPFLTSRALFWGTLSVVLVTSCIVTQKIFLEEHANGYVEVYFLNVGQGDSIYIVAPNGNSMLVDGGQMDNKARDVLGKIKKSVSSHIDVLLATHADGDHIGGLIQVLDTYATSLFVESGYTSATDVYKILQSKIKKRKIENIFLYTKSKIVLDKESGVYLNVLHPSFEFVENRVKECEQKKKKNKKCNLLYDVDTNDMSLVLQLEYGDKKVLLTGDASVEVENFLMKSNLLNSNILKLGHHGSKSSSGENFLKVTNPEYSIVSAGLKNRYGHPHKSVIDGVTRNTHSKIIETKNSKYYVRFKIFKDKIEVEEK